MMFGVKKPTRKSFCPLMPLVTARPSSKPSTDVYKRQSQAGTLTREYLHHLLTEEKPNQRQKFFLNQEDVKKFFPPNYTPEQMHNTILLLLRNWQHKRGYNKNQPER